MVQQIVTLNPGESKIVSFTAIPNEAKTYNVTVDGLSGSFQAIAKVASKPAIQQFFVVTMPRDSRTRGPYEVHCLIQNIGEGTGTHKATLYADGAVVTTETFTIAPGETHDFVYSWGLAPYGATGTFWVVGDWGEETPHIPFTAGYYTTEQATLGCVKATATTAVLRYASVSDCNEWDFACSTPYDPGDIRNVQELWRHIKVDKDWSSIFCAFTGLLPSRPYAGYGCGTDYGYREAWTTFRTSG